MSLPLLLLLAVGGILGGVAPIAKAAVTAGVPPATYVFWMALTAGVVLAGLAVARGQPLRRRHLRYALVSGLVSLALPNLLVTMVVAPLGAGPTALVFTLPPLLTLGLAAALRIETLGPRRIAGVLLGLAGAATLVLARFGFAGAAEAGWMALALAIPVSLAVGNVYRTLAWPQGAQPLTLAAGLMLAAALWLLPVALWQGILTHVEHWSIWTQAALMALSYVLFFRLQRAAGPVYLSQIGYVGAAVGLVVGVTVYGEHPGWGAAVGVALIALGVVLGQRRAPKEAS